MTNAEALEHFRGMIEFYPKGSAGHALIEAHIDELLMGLPIWNPE